MKCRIHGLEGELVKKWQLRGATVGLYKCPAGHYYRAKA